MLIGLDLLVALLVVSIALLAYTGQYIRDQRVLAASFYRSANALLADSLFQSSLYPAYMTGRLAKNAQPAASNSVPRLVMADAGLGNWGAP